MADRIDGYAAAVFEFASAEDDLARVEQELFTIAQTVESTPDLRSALTDPALPIDRKQAVINDLVGGRASKVTVNLVTMIAAQGRVADLSEVSRRLSQRTAASKGGQVAEVRSAVELDDATVQRLAAALSKQAGRPVEVRTVVDPDVMGGIVARIGDTVIDGSIRRRLDSLRQTLQNQ